MKKYTIIIAVMVLALFCLTSCGKKVEDERIVGLWKSDFYGSYEFKGNGQVVLGSGKAWDYETKDGKVKIDEGIFGDCVYNYEFTKGRTADGEVKEYLALWKEYEGTASKKYYERIR